MTAKPEPFEETPTRRPGKADGMCMYKGCTNEVPEHNTNLFYCTTRCGRLANPGVWSKNPGVYQFMVVIFREQTPEVYGFYELSSAEKFAEEAGAQWSETFLTEVIKGPLV